MLIDAIWILRTKRWTSCFSLDSIIQALLSFNYCCTDLQRCQHSVQLNFSLRKPKVLSQLKEFKDLQCVAKKFSIYSQKQCFPRLSKLVKLLRQAINCIQILYLNTCQNILVLSCKRGHKRANGIKMEIDIFFKVCNEMWGGYMSNNRWI